MPRRERDISTTFMPRYSLQPIKEERTKYRVRKYRHRHVRWSSTTHTSFKNHKLPKTGKWWERTLVFIWRPNYE